ncbi:MAG: hypothetical protein IPM54_11775 [Polyangiaceae bacterium]|nr:hypothetical protein [Polyangiaceae bacterium]
MRNAFPSVLSAPLLALFAIATSGCDPTATAATPPVSTSATVPARAAAAPDEGETCRTRIDTVLASPKAPGAPAFDAVRIEILGRVRGEPVHFVREPQATPESALDPRLVASAKVFASQRPGGRVVNLLKRHKYDPRALRSLLLREGYAYAPDPMDALMLITQVKLTDLFDEPQIFLARGTSIRPLTRTKINKEFRYVDATGKPADMLFGDRVAVTEKELATPLHRDVAALSESAGFDRMRIRHATTEAIVADVRFGETWASSLLVSDGPKVSLACIAEEKPVRDTIATYLESSAPHRRAMQAIRDTITKVVDESFRFDRPEREPDHFRDGILRPQWMTAYLQGRTSYTFEKHTYSVFGPSGLAWPPEVCVDFIVDTYERAAGSWFRPQGEPPGRTPGRLSLSAPKKPAPRGVIGFADFAEDSPELFAVVRYQGTQRVPFGERTRFFENLRDNADLRPGDIVAIQGLKRDDYVHQHGIFVERTDPMTGFPYGLADQMKRPRRRTWEGIMAEAPKRSLYYRARPTEKMMKKIDPGPATQ